MFFPFRAALATLLALCVVPDALALPLVARQQAVTDLDVLQFALTVR
jgi:hypothetical protein